MHKLSERLKVMADNTIDSKTVADIGSDHGFLPVYLIERGLCRKVIVTDISRPSLEKAIVNCRKAFGDDEYNSHGRKSRLQMMEFRQGSGLQVLEKAEADAVVIGGMGGKLIRDIMDWDFDHTCSFKKFVLQPRIGQGHLRKWLLEKGFTITGEDVVEEGNFLPEIITAVSPKFVPDDEPINCGTDLSDYDGDDIICKVPPWMSRSGGHAEELVRRSLNREKDILKNVRMSRTRDYLREDKLRENIEYLERIVKEIQYGK